MQALQVAGQSSPFTANYTFAGRPTAFIDPFTNTTIGTNTIAAHILSYGSDGQLASERLSNGGQYLGITHDAEGNPTGYSLSMNGYMQKSIDVVKKSLGYNVRSELYDQLATAQNGATSDTQYQDLFGHMCQLGGCGTIDPKTGAVLSGVNVGTVDGCSGSFTVGYDYAGRLNGYTGTESGKGQNSNGDPCMAQGPTSQDGRTYDADNRTVSDACTPTIIALCNSGSWSYSWAPTGSMSRYVYSAGGNSYGYNLHWDGGRLLFVTDDQGHLAQLNVGTLAQITNPTTQYGNAYTGLTVFDRDFTNALPTMHQSAGVAPWTVAGNAYKVNRWTGVQTQTLNGIYPGFGTFNINNTTTNPIADMSRTDGVGIGSPFFQGVRAYDPFANQWTSPDPYAGTAMAATQQSYTWNGNNPITNRDPRGLDTLTPGGTTCGENPVVTDDGKGDITVSYYFDGSGCGDSSGYGWGAGDFGLANWGDSGRPNGHSVVGTVNCVERGLPQGVKAPPQGFSPEYAAGVQNGAWNLAALMTLTTGTGRFNYGQYQDRTFRGTANFGLGVYAAGSGIGIGYIWEAIDQQGESHGLSADKDRQDRLWALAGLQWADQRCRH